MHGTIDLDARVVVAVMVRWICGVVCILRKREESLYVRAVLEDACRSRRRRKKCVMRERNVERE